jgi:hypothetical protein
MTGEFSTPDDTTSAMVLHCATCGVRLKRSECFRASDGSAVAETEPVPDVVQCLGCASVTPPAPHSVEAKIWERL